MAIVGQLLVNLRANTASYARDLKKAKNISFSNAKEIKRSLAMIGKAAAVMGVAIVASFGYLIKKSIDAADKLAKLSRSTGLSVESLSGLSYAAELAGVNQDTLAARMVNLNRRAKEAARGVKTYALAFDTLGIKLTDSEGKLRSTEDLLFDVADAFKGMEDGSMKAALATDILSNQGVGMISFLNEGSDGLREFMEEAKRTGNVISLKTALAAERFNDNLTRLSKSGQGLTNIMMAELIPMLDLFAGKMGVDIEDSPFGKGVVFIGEAARRTAGSLMLAVAAGEQLGTYWRTNWAAAINLARGDWAGFKAAYSVGLTDMGQTTEEVFDNILQLWVSHQAELERVTKRPPPAADPAKAGAALKTFRANIIYVNDALLQQAEIMQELTGRSPSLKTFVELAAESMDDLAEASLKAGVAIDEGIASDVIRKKLKEYRDALKVVKEGTDEIARASEDMAHVVGTAFEDAILRGEGLRDVFKGLLEDIMRIMLRMAITKPLEGLFSPKGAIGSLLGGLFGGGRQHGGPVEPGKAYVVGEGGVPEIFMPDARGKIIPLKHGAAVVNNTYIDARGAEGATEAKIRRALIATHESAVEISQRRFADNARRSA